MGDARLAKRRKEDIVGNKQEPEQGAGHCLNKAPTTSTKSPCLHKAPATPCHTPRLSEARTHPNNTSCLPHTPHTHTLPQGGSGARSKPRTPGGRRRRRKLLARRHLGWVVACKGIGVWDGACCL